MKMLLIAKTSVFIMTGLIIAGLTLIAFKITDNHKKDKSQNPNTAFLLGADEKITHLSDCGSFACLISETKTGQTRLLIFNPDTGRLHHQILLKKE